MTPLKRTFIVLIAFALYCVLTQADVFFHLFIDVFGGLPSYLYSFLKNLFNGLPIFATLFWFYRPNQIASKVGLKGLKLKGCIGLFLLSFGVMGATMAYSYYTAPAKISTTPESGGLLGLLNLMEGPSFSWEWLLSIVFRGFSGRLFFIGFLFTQLFRYLRWGFIPAVIVGPVLFFLSQSIFGGLSVIGLFSTVLGALTTFLISSLSYWLYAEWDYNLWIPIGVTIVYDVFIQLAYQYKLNGWVVLLVQPLCMAAMVLATMRYKRKRNLPYEVNGRTLWYKKPAMQLAESAA